VRTTEDPSDSVNVSTFEADAGGVENTLDVIDIGSTVNVEPDIVRVSGPVTEELAGRVRVTTDPLGSVSVCTIEDADPSSLVDVRELETVERDTIFEVDGSTGPLELVVVLETHVLVGIDDCGEVEELMLPLALLVDLKVNGELELAGVLKYSLHDEAVEEKTVESVVLELHQVVVRVVVTVVQDEEPPVGTYWRTPRATGLEKEVPARAARLDRPIICFNAISAGRLQWPRRTMAKPRAAG
jgi:hypothetical protein